VTRHLDVIKRVIQKMSIGAAKIDMANSEPGPISLDDAMRVIREHGKSAPVAARIFEQILRDLVAPYHGALSWGDRLLTLDKSAEFKADPQFKRAVEQCKSSTGANQYSSPDGIAWRLNTLIWAGRCALKVAGDFVECGVYQGDMSWVVSELIDLPRAGKTFYLYDTFEGFSPKYSSPADFPDAPQLLDISNHTYKVPQLYEFVRDRFAAKPYVKVIKGVVPDILHELSPSEIAFLHIDMNSPDAETGALEVLFDRVSSGGPVIFDDYGWAVFRKQKIAADRFMAARGYDILELPTGQGLMIKR
jgi:O-methyltransferase